MAVVDKSVLKDYFRGGIPNTELDGAFFIDLIDTLLDKSDKIDPDQIEGPVDVQFSDSTNIDAFGRLRISDPVTLFDSQNQYDLQPWLWAEDLTSGATIVHDADGASATMDVTGTTGSKAIRQTRNYNRYQPGKSQEILITFDTGSLTSGTRARIGYFDDKNGIFLENDGNNLSLVVRSSATGSVVDSSVAQASWNIDPMDGTGPSGITLDMTKANILAMDLEWLGVGRVRYAFVIDGRIVPVHQNLHANVGSGVYMTTANLPVRYELENTGGAGDSIEAICASVISEGGFETQRGFPASATNGSSLTSVTTRRPILSLRPATTFNSIENRQTFIFDQLALYASGNGALIETVYNPTSLTGASWSSVGSDSGMEVDTSATAISGGTTLSQVFIAASSQGNQNSPSASRLGLTERLPFGLDVNGTNPDVISIVATSLNATADLGVAFNWRELR